MRYDEGGHALSPSGLVADSRVFEIETRVLAVAEYIEKHHEALFFLKTDDWATEYEYRALLLSPSDEYAYVSYADALAAVVVGEEFPAWQLPGAQAVCEDAHVELRQITWKLGVPWAKAPRAINRTCPSSHSRGG